MTNLRTIPNEFVMHIRESVRTVQSEYPHSNLMGAFSQWAMSLVLTELDDDDIFSLVLDTSGPNATCINAFFVDEKNGIFYIFVGKYGQEPQVYPRDVIDEVCDLYEALLDGSKEVDSVSSELQESVKHGFEIKVCFLLFGEFKEELDNYLDQKAANLRNVSFLIYDLFALYEQYMLVNGVRQEIDDIELVLQLHRSQSNVIRIANIAPEAIVANVDLSQYAQQVRNYIPRIFDANVRNPLRNKINKKMEETLLDENTRKYFWHYNNGLTILVSDIRVTEENIWIKAPTIVNGCQTTATIARVVEKLKDQSAQIDLPLLVRFIRLGRTNEDEAVRVNISRYTNAQAPVVAPDFKSNDLEQETVAASFEMLNPRVFYERKRGQWDMLSGKEKKRYDRHVKMVDVAQRWYAFMHSPSSAIVNKGQLFQEEGTYRSVFSPPLSATEYLVAYLLFEQFDKYLATKKRESERKTDLLSQLFTKLARARNLASAHLVHLVQKLLTRKYGAFDYEIASSVLDKVRDPEWFSTLTPHLVTVLQQYDRTLDPKLPWLNALKREDTIKELDSILSQHLETYLATLKINVLDYI